jgi:hypothetical protein
MFGKSGAIQVIESNNFNEGTTIAVCFDVGEE